MIMPILAVSDLPRSIKFYTETLGFQHTFSMPGPDGVDSFAIVVFSPTVSFGLGVEPQYAGQGAGVDLMVYVPESSDLDAYYASVKAKGANIMQEIKDEFWGDRLFVLTDPDGYKLSICKTVKQVDYADILKSVQSSNDG